MAHPKGLLMERLKKQGISPEFRTANTGPDHEPTFLTDVVVNGEVLGTGQGGNKREAERLAAEEAIAYLDRNPLELEVISPGRSTGGKTGKSDQKTAEEPKGSGRKAASAEEPKKRGRKATQAEESKASGQRPARQRRQDVPAADEGLDRFEGPWPVFENLLAGIVEVAGERVDEDLKGEEARVAVRDFTLELYKDLLEDLGDVVEEDEEE